MDITIKIAIISACSALIGSLIPTLISYFNNKIQNDFELKKDLRQNQKEVYNDIMIALQEMINKQETETFYVLQKATIKLAIYGDNKSSKAMNKYYDEIVKSAQKKRPPLTPEEHKKHQENLINGMRENLGLDNFDSFEVVGYRPKK